MIGEYYSATGLCWGSTNFRCWSRTCGGDDSSFRQSGKCVDIAGGWRCSPRDVAPVHSRRQIREAGMARYPPVHHTGLAPVSGARLGHSPPSAENRHERSGPTESILQPARSSRAIRSIERIGPPRAGRTDTRIIAKPRQAPVKWPYLPAGSQNAPADSRQGRSGCASEACSPRLSGGPGPGGQARRPRGKSTDHFTA